jgi:putative transposase
MNKIAFPIDSKVYYDSKTYIVKGLVDFHTLLIQSIDDKNLILEIKTDELSLKLDKPNQIIDSYTDEEWANAKDKYEIIQNLVFKSRSKKDVEFVAKKFKKGINTIYRWIRAYEATENISSLVSNECKRGKKGSRMNPLVDKIIDDILEEFYLTKQKIGFPKIYRNIKKECMNLKLTPPHANSIRNRIKSIDPKLAMKKRESYQKANREFSNFEGEFPEGKYPLDVYQIDHTPLDIIVVDKINRKALGRPYLTLAIDIYSRMIAGFYISLHGPGYFNVSQCLYNSFIKKEQLLSYYGIKGEWNIFGLPRIIHVDNGADLVGKDMQKVCDEFGITLMKRPVARPQFGAHVERVLGTINKEVHNLPGSTDSTITERGTYDSVKNASLTVDELMKWLLQFIVNTYHKKKHLGINMTPDEKYYKGIFGDENNPGTGVLPSVIEDEETIRIMLLPTFYRTIQKDGITLDGITYYSDVLRQWINKKDNDSKKIKFKIKRDPLNIQKIYFFDPQLKIYFDINYRRIEAPPMTLWDMLSAKRYLKEQYISDYGENDIFDAYEILSKIEEEAKEKTRKAKIKIRKNKSPKMVDIKKEEIKNSVRDNILKNDNKEEANELFKDIKIFEVDGKLS